MSKVLSAVFKVTAVLLFLIFLGGIIFKVTHMPYNSDENIRNTVSKKKENAELIYNSESAENVINEINDINGVEAVSLFELNGNVLIGIESVFSEKEYENSLENFSKIMVLEYLGVRNENILVEINTSFTEDISELSYYASRGLDANILNSRFNDIYRRLLESKRES